MGDKLANRVAVITGGGNGVGRGIAHLMAEEGAKIVIVDIGKEKDGTGSADKVVAEIKGQGGEALASAENIVKAEGGENIIRNTVDTFGRVDILVCCAGNIIRKPAVELTDADWDSVMNVHAKGHFNLMKPAAKEMMKNKFGRIITVASRAAAGYGGCAVYSAAKAAILGLTSAFAHELKKDGITVNSLIPSADTQLFPGERPKPIPGQKMLPPSMNIDPSYIAPMIAYLATDEAAGITNKYFYASGGDICFFPKLLEVPGESVPIFLRTNGKWTIDKLAEVVPNLLGIVA